MKERGLLFYVVMQDPATVSAAYINCNIGASPVHSVTSPGPGYLNITQERPNTLAVAPDTRHEYENVGPDTQTQSPGYVAPRWGRPNGDPVLIICCLQASCSQA